MPLDCSLFEFEFLFLEVMYLNLLKINVGAYYTNGNIT